MNNDDGNRRRGMSAAVTMTIIGCTMTVAASLVAGAISVFRLGQTIERSVQRTESAIATLRRDLSDACDENARRFIDINKSLAKHAEDDWSLLDQREWGLETSMRNRNLPWNPRPIQKANYP